MRYNDSVTAQLHLFQELCEEFPRINFKAQYPLGEHTYFKLGGNAQVFCELKHEADIVALFKHCFANRISFVVLGGGSNCIVPDEGVDGLVIAIKNDSFETAANPQPDGLHAGKTFVEIGAGTRTSLAVSKTTSHGFIGLENFLGVPGTIGGAVFNNAHYLQDLIGSYVDSVVVLDSSGEVSRIPASECGFGYDSSRFQATNEIILRVRFALASGDTATSQAKIKRATEYRATTQPLGLPSSGCIFQNVPNTAALRTLFPQFAEKAHVPGGFLIDQAGLKLAREGDIEVSQKHAAFFVNKGHGTAAQVTALINKVKRTVREKFGVELQEEVFWLRPRSV